ncbi:MAG: hypothetical protein IT518_20145 [Burkholderiales bacterium]|nr:hypothetical protein [Burkholderiales bacterium]
MNDLSAIDELNASYLAMTVMLAALAQTHPNPQLLREHYERQLGETLLAQRAHFSPQTLASVQKFGEVQMHWLADPLRREREAN